MVIVIIDDNKIELDMCTHIVKKLCSDNDRVFCSKTVDDGIELIRKHHPDIVMTDLMFPEGSGLDIIKKTKEINPTIEIMVITAAGSIDTAVESMKLGAYDYILKETVQPMLQEKIQHLFSYINSKTELDDYRSATEAMEENAHNLLFEKEMIISEYQEQFNDIKKALQEDIPHEEKLKKITSLIM